MGKAVLFIRCNGGHYFSGGSHCPLDNWSSPESEQLTQAVEKLCDARLDVSMARLHEHGVSEAAMKRAIVIEFGSEEAVFAGFVPEGYIMEDGGFVPLLELGLDFF